MNRVRIILPLVLGVSLATGASVAAWFTTIGLGSETGFSVRTPASDCNLYGLSSTSGLISRDGEIVGWLTEERPGPLARSVHDLAVTLDVIAGFVEIVRRVLRLSTPIERDRLSFIETVDDFAGAHPILVRFAKIIAKRLAGEQTLGHAEEHDVCRVVEFQRQIGMMDEVDPQEIRHRFVIALPG